MISNIPDELIFETINNKVKFSLGDMSTGWLDCDDSFIQRIDESNMNKIFLTQHIVKEIEIKNVLDEGISFLKSGKLINAIGNFDEVLFYDPEYANALLYKSFALRGQKHFVKALRHYKHAVKCDAGLKDIDYHKTLLKEANNERDNFPKLKLNIFAGDEYFAKGEYGNAVDSYNRALANPSKFKEKILSKLLNKKATALMKLENFNEALDCFKESQNVSVNDYAIFGEGVCEHQLGMQVCDEFKTKLDITKKQMLKQIQILNKNGYFAESLAINDFLFENHFMIDDFYFKLLNARKYAMKELDMDLTKINEIINQIVEKPL
ncbi:hypothetical protein [Methanobrevibacter sp.]|uniref:tetratricopeptide repeat protein n=1 Tax=Methanobrevibacter sp. TaxID=66852 RepID=UPI0025E458B0|nr:hypothetical protein [Methanobrevibacter sp.]MBQ2666011.1 hypothetical protein [Methanobrevibacter sp.]